MLDYKLVPAVTVIENRLKFINTIKDEYLVHPEKIFKVKLSEDDQLAYNTVLNDWKNIDELPWRGDHHIRFYDFVNSPLVDWANLQNYLSTGASAGKSLTATEDDNQESRLFLTDIHRDSLTIYPAIVDSLVDDEAMEDLVGKVNTWSTKGIFNVLGSFHDEVIWMDQDVDDVVYPTIKFNWNDYEESSSNDFSTLYSTLGYFRKLMTENGYWVQFDTSHIMRDQLIDIHFNLECAIKYSKFIDMK